MMFNATSLVFDANYLNLEIYAFDAKYSDLEHFDRGLPINKIAPTLCIYEIFTDNFVVSWASTCTPSHAHDLVLVLGFDVYPVPCPRPCPRPFPEPRPTRPEFRPHPANLA
jgi:hypothetical protein